MAAPAPWKVQVRQRVVSAEDHVSRAQKELALAKAFFEMPVPPERAAQGPQALLAAFRLKLVLAMERLTEATQYLSYAVASMDAAEILALHVSSLAHESLPLHSVHHFLRPLEAAQGFLKVSRAIAKDACDSTEWCRGHLSMQIAMVDNTEAIPDAMDYAFQEQNTACHALTHAIGRTYAAEVEVGIASRILHLP